MSRQRPNEPSRNCECGGDIETIGACATSRVEHCTECHECILQVTSEEFQASVPLELFFHARIDAKNETSFEQVTRAPKHLFRALVMDLWPNDLVGTLFGIESEKHLGTLQQLARAGVTAVEFDRVMGDGNAITALANALRHNPYGNVEFVTPFDEFRQQLKPARVQDIKTSFDREP